MKKEIVQNDVDVEFFQKGISSRQTITRQEAQYMMDEMLESNNINFYQYNSFWAGWEDSMSKIVLI